MEKKDAEKKLSYEDKALISARMSAHWIRMREEHSVAPIDEASHMMAAGCFTVGENFPNTGATWAAMRLDRETVAWHDLSRSDRSDILARCRGIVGMQNCAANLRNGVRHTH